MCKKGSTLFPQVINFLLIVLVLAFNAYSLIIVTAFIRAVVSEIGWVMAGRAGLRFGGVGKFSLRSRPLSLGEITVSLGIALIGLAALVWIDSRQKKSAVPATVPAAATASIFGNNGPTPPQMLAETQPVI